MKISVLLVCIYVILTCEKQSYSYEIGNKSKVQQITDKQATQKIK